MPSKPNVYLFVPNLIGYARIILAVIAFHYANSNYQSRSRFSTCSGLLLIN
jgi:hypothetical protein